MTVSDPYQEMFEAPKAPTMSIVSKALAAYSKTGLDPQDDDIDPDRVKILLKKVFGDDAKYVTIPQPDDWTDKIIFEIDGILLKFRQGTTPEEDGFEIAYAYCTAPHQVRTLEGLGAALSAAILLAKSFIADVASNQMVRDRSKLRHENADDDFDDDEE